MKKSKPISTVITVITAITVILIMGLAAACSSSGKQGAVNTSPDNTRNDQENDLEKGDPFFETARLIMNREEIQIYKHLASESDKEEFIREFWEKRDPNPETEDNQYQEEFEERIRYANKWFREHSRGRGWDTERGRLLLQLGFPDRREFGEANDTVRSGRMSNLGRLITSKPVPMEIWTYYRYQMVLTFADFDDRGRLELVRVPPELPYALNHSKSLLDLKDQTSMRDAFRFEVKYKAGHLLVTIPIKRLTFGEEDGRMTVEFDVTFYVYRDKEKAGEVNLPQTFSMAKEELLQLKQIQLTIPYEITQKGKYHFDIVIEEKSSGARFRDFANYKR